MNLKMSNGAGDDTAIIDSNIWIFAENETAEECIRAKNALIKYASGSFQINAIVVAETFHILSKLIGKAEARTRAMHLAGNPRAAWLEITDSLVRGAINLSFEENIRINDAIIAQQALELGVPVLTDNLKDFKKVRGLKIIPLRGL